MKMKIKDELIRKQEFKETEPIFKETMKSTIRIPTEQYAFVEIVVEDKTLYELKEIYDDTKKMFEIKTGIEDKLWRDTLDRYLTDNSMDADIYYSMSPEQQKVIQEIKKSIKRIESKNQDESNTN